MLILYIISSVFFDTYEYERDQATMHFYNERSFDKFDVFEYTIADVIFEYWEKHDDAYLPYTKENDKKIWDLKSVVKNAEDGRLGDISAKVGDGMTSVYEQNKAFGDIGVTGGQWVQSLKFITIHILLVMNRQILTLLPAKLN